MNNKIYKQKLQKYEKENNHYKIKKYRHKIMTGGSNNIYSLVCHGTYLQKMANCGSDIKLQNNNIIIFLEDIGTDLDEYKIILFLTALKYDEGFKRYFYDFFYRDFADINRGLSELTYHAYVNGSFYLLNELITNGMDHEMFLRLLYAHTDGDSEYNALFPDTIKNNPCYGQDDNLNLFVLTMNPILFELLIRCNLFDNSRFELLKNFILSGNIREYATNIAGGFIAELILKENFQIKYQIYKNGSYIPYYLFNLNNVIQITNKNATKQYLINYNDTVLYGMKGGIRSIDEDKSISEKFIYSRGNLNFTKNLTTINTLNDIQMCNLTHLKIEKNVNFILSQFNDTYPPKSVLDTLNNPEYIYKEMINDDYKIVHPAFNSCSLVSYVNTHFANSILILGCCGSISDLDPMPSF